MAPAPVYNFHDARLSLAQSAIREVICKQIQGGAGPGLWADHPVLRAASAVLDGIHRGAIADAGTARATYRATRATQAQAMPAAEEIGGIAEDCLDLLAEYALAWALREAATMAEIQSEFIDNECDPGWIEAMVAWLEYYWDDQAPQYNPPQGDSPGPIPLPPAASTDGLLRVGVLGDWGTGEPDAATVLDQLMQLNPDVILHVGDIYYAGTPDECQTNFLVPINTARANHRAIPVYTLAGNHDYYSGGGGYYNMLATLNEGIEYAQTQANSFFCLQNDDWQLEGMDTGYNDHDLPDVGEDYTWLQDVEVDWHTAQIRAAGSRKVILFSHHQLFSAFQTIGSGYRNESLAGNLATWQGAGNNNVVAWLWGHEHLLEVYAPAGSGSPPLPILGRCIGHGAFPVFNNLGLYDKQTETVPLAPASTPSGYVQTGDENLVYDHGFALLTLGAGTGTIAYYQVTIPFDGSAPSSQVLWTDTIPATTAR